MVITENIKNSIREHSLKENPKECCGLFFVEKNSHEPQIHLCSNSHEDPINFFAINPKDYLKAASKGSVIGFYHSHTENERFSDFDIINAENFKLDSLLYCIKNDCFYEYKPVGYELPYINRQYVVGFIDCFSLIRDFYFRERNINISELDHPYRFVEEKDKHPDNNGVSSVLPDHFIKNNFIKVSDLKDEDVILMKTNLIESPVHCGIYKDNEQILHHPYKRFSILEHYRQIHRNWTTHILRHKSLL